MFPFVYSPTYEYPLSGDVIQDIAPMISWRYEGLPEVEQEVYASVASPGKQLGKLCEAVLRLAEEAGLDPEKVKEIGAIKSIADGVDDAKITARDAAMARAEAMTARAAKLEKIGPD